MTTTEAQKEVNQAAIDYAKLLRERLARENERREMKDRRVAALILKHDLKAACEELEEVGVGG